MKAARIKSDQLLEMKKPRQNSIDIDEVRRILKQNAGRKKSLYDILLDYNTILRPPIERLNLFLQVSFF